MAVSDILISPATVWYAPVGEPLPDETSISFGEDWGGNWESLGYTLQPLSLMYTREIFSLFVEQITPPVKRKKVQEDYAIETVLAEFTGANIGLLFDGTVTSTNAGASQVAFTQVKAGGKSTLDDYAWGFEGVYQDDANNEHPVRIFFAKGNATLNGNLTFAKNAGVGIPLRVDMLPDTTQPVGQQYITVQIVTAPASS